MKKIINFVYKLMICIIICNFSIALIGGTFFCVYRSRNYSNLLQYIAQKISPLINIDLSKINVITDYNYLNPIVLIIGSIISILLIKKIYNRIIKLPEKNKKYIIVGLLCIQIIMLGISFIKIQSIPQVDLIHILTGINSLNITNEITNIDYFSIYSNNRFLLIILYYIQNISVENNQIIFGMISTMSISTMTFFTYKTVKELSGIDKGILSLMITVLSPIFYLYVSYFYTDILSLPFASILIYLIVKTKNNDNLKHNIIYSLLIGMIGVIGYKIRAISIFLLIAYLIYLIININKKCIITKVIPIILGVIITFISITTLENNFFKKIDREKEFTITHWIMMGVNTEKYGIYNQKDYNLSNSVKTKKERQELNIKTINNRIKESNIYDKAKLLILKSVIIWGRGDYTYQKYLKLVNNYNNTYSYLLEDKNIIINYLLQISKIVILCMSIKSLIKLNKEKEISIISISLFGGIIFYSIWEICPRYGLSFLPWLIILSSYSYEHIGAKLEEKLTIKRKYLILVLTAILLVSGAIKYTIPTEKESIIDMNTTTRQVYAKLNTNEQLLQSIKPINKFNQISLKFQVDNDTEIKLEILDKEKEVISNKNITILQKNNKKYSKINLDNYIEKAQYIKITTSESLKFATAYKEFYDFYPNGNLFINDKELNGDLMFELKNIKQRGTYSYIEYLLLAIIIFCIEYKVLFIKSKKRNKK